MIILMDLDGTTRDFITSLENKYDSIYENDISYYRTPVVHYDLARSFHIGKDIYDFIYKDYPKDIFLNAKPYKGAVEFMEWLHKMFYIRIVTAQPDKRTENLAMKWLQENKIPFDHFVCTHEKQEENFDIAVEDSPIHIEKIKKKGKKVIKINRLWNQNVDDVPSGDNYEEIKSILLELIH